MSGLSSGSISDEGQKDHGFHHKSARPDGVDAPECIYLWEEGKMSVETVYDKNDDFQYDWVTHAAAFLEDAFAG